MPQGFSGVGLVSSHVRTASGGKGTGTLWGNCPKFDVAASPNVVERNSSMDVSRSPLRRMTGATSLEVTVVCDEFNKKNIARFMQGRIDEVAADAATTLNYTCQTGAAVGDVLAVPDLNVTNVVITDSSATPKTLVKDTNYQSDDFSGHYVLMDITTGGAFVQPFKVAYKKGAVSVVAGLAAPTTDIWVTMSGTNADDLTRGHLDVYRVRFPAAAVIGYINSDYNDFELKGTALVDTTKPVSAVGGNVFRWAMPSTHE